MKEQVLKGDCLDIVPLLKKQSVDLIYLDPPFFTNKIQKLKTRDGKKEFSYEDIWEDQKEYAKFMFDRLFALKDVLKDTGSIFVHCDRNATHIIKAVMDDVFGCDNFQSEIIWYYKRWSNAKKGLLSSHQTIYFYSKTKNFKFNTIYTEYSETTNIDQILQKRIKDNNGKTIYAKDNNGEVVASDTKKGVPLSDVWEIPYLNPKAKERTGYPTQKPILLLERIIDIASDEGDTILDPFCGSGTSLVAGKIKNRNVIGIDISDDAAELSKQRLSTPFKSDSLVLKKGRGAYLNNDLAELFLYGIDYIPVQRNNGIDAVLKKQFDSKPILVKIQKDHESLEEATNLLYKAALSKSSKKSFLIRTNDIKSLFNHESKPNIIEIIDAINFRINYALI